jgi:hypothetical protein
MKPRSVDWSLAALVALLAATGFLTIFSGAAGNAWVFVAHDVLGFSLAGVLVWKLRRVLASVRAPSRGVAALVAVGLVLGTGIAWSFGVRLSAAGYNLMNWHWVFGGLLAAAVLAHALARARPLRRRDVAGRRQVLQAGAVGLGALAVWAVQRPVAGVLGLRGEHRRFTGSYEVASFDGNAFPTTSWVADSPRRVGGPLEVTGRVARPLRVSASELDGDEIVATLDCTGGFYSTQRWQGCSLGRLLDRAGPAEESSHVRVVSHTGYRWSFPLSEARGLLLATHVGGEPLSHGHGSPVRLVAPGHRGFEWVKWVVRVEVHDGPDPGALASTVWSSLTPEGRGA